MRNLLSILFSFVSFVMFSQNINDLEKRKTELNSSKTLLEQSKKNNNKYYDSILANIEFEKKNLELPKSKLTKSHDSLIKLIEPFGISENNLKMYYVLKNEKIIDPNSRKFDKYHKYLLKAFNFSEDQKFLVISEFVCLEQLDKNGRISSFEKIKLSSDQIEKQNKLLFKKSISLISENNLILENLTGVNSRYLFLKDQLAGINDKLNALNSEIKSNSERKENIYIEFTQKKNNIEHEIEGITKLINEIDFQIIQINEQIALDTAKTFNYSKFKTKKINGIEVCTAPLSVREFKNGDEIKKARTEGEWNKFNELKIPCYHFKDFDDNQANYGFIYNYHAITDNRELAPHGFHKLNLIDFNYLGNQLLFTDTKLVDCYCGDGTEGIYESCTNCNYWTETQRKYNVCSKCQNRRYFNRGTKSCSRCIGTKKVKAINMADRVFCVFPSSTNKVAFENNLDFNYVQDDNLLGVLKIDFNGKCNLKSYSTEDIDFYSAPDIGYNEQGFQVLICKDRNVNNSDDFASTKIGDIEIMNTYLNVTKFRNGDPIKYIEDPVEWELALKNKIPAYCYFNNVNDGKGCIYNIHAWNDKRGLMPLNWRSITKNDLINMAFTLNYEFTLTSANSPIKPPKGVINKNGVFETIDTKKNYDRINRDYFNHLNFSIQEETYPEGVKYELRTKNEWSRNVESGYVLCVRDASNIVKVNNSPSQILNKESLINNSQLLIKDDKYFEAHSKSGDYMGIYNEPGLKLIDNLVQTDFDDLFDENDEIRIIAMDVELTCENIYCCGYTEYTYTGGGGDQIYGIIIKKSSTSSSGLSCSAIIANTSQYNRDYDIIESSDLKRADELSFSCKDLRLDFCFSKNKCNPADNPIDNFYVLVNNHFGINTTWYNEVKGAWWDRDEEWALEQVLEFMDTH